MQGTLREMCLQITNACPLRCLHCSTRGGLPHQNELPLARLMEAIQEFSALGGSILELSGGEPLVYPHLPEIVQLAASLGLEVRLYSSGVDGYSAGRARSAARETWQSLKESGLAKVFFNLQGPCAEVHEGITLIPGSYEAVVQSLKTTKSLGLYVGIHFVPMRRNFELLDQTVGLATGWGADEFAVLRFVAQGRGLDNRKLLMLSPVEFGKFMANAVRVRDVQTGIRFRLGCPFNHRILAGDSVSPAVCNAGTFVCHVNPSGEVLPCSAFQQGFISFGNLRDQSLAALWESQRWRLFRELKERGPAPGSAEFILEAGDPCLAQIANGDVQPLDVTLVPD